MNIYLALCLLIIIKCSTGDIVIRSRRFILNFGAGDFTIINSMGEEKKKYIKQIFANALIKECTKKAPFIMI